MEKRSLEYTMISTNIYRTIEQNAVADEKKNAKWGVDISEIWA